MKSICIFLIGIICISIFILPSCSSDDTDTLKGKAYILQSNSYTKYCLSFDNVTTGRYFSLYSGESSYTLNNNSIVNFTYSYDYPTLSITPEESITRVSGNYTFLTKKSFSDGEYTWVKCDIDSLLTTTVDNGSGSNSDNNNTEGHSCSISPTSKTIDGGTGSFSISVSSNTNWSVSMNNSGSQCITGMKISPTSGSGNGSITVSYSAAGTTNYQQSGVVLVTYTGYGGYRQTLTCSVSRKHLP